MARDRSAIFAAIDAVPRHSRQHERPTPTAARWGEQGTRHTRPDADRRVCQILTVARLQYGIECWKSRS